jgi:amino acid transporter
MTGDDRRSRTGTPLAEVDLARPVGLLGGIALVIGGVIGMGIYALIAAVAAQAGSALWLAFLLAVIVSAIGVAPLIQIASALPRELFCQARDGVMPAWLGKIEPRTRSPLHAVIAYFLFTGLLLCLGQHIDFYGVATAVGILHMTAGIAVAAVRLPGCDEG